MILNNWRKPRRPTLRDRRDAEEKLRELALLPVEELLERLSASRDGLTGEQAQARLEEAGPNVITAGRGGTLGKRLREALINPFNLVLIAIALITYLTDLAASAPDYLTIIIILSLVSVSSIIAFVQGRRSDAAAQKLSQMITNSADVLRDGRFVSIPMGEVVPGDIVKLSAGDMLPADVRFLATKDAFVAQAALTGESVPVEKFSGAVPGPKDSLTDFKHMGFLGSNVVSGSATALVLATGNSTYVGAMAISLTGDRAKTSFEKGVDAVSGLLMRRMLVMVPVMFLINGLVKGSWVEALLFSVSIAVGLTPEMLPVIMTSTLAKGAVSMSRHAVIVRTLGAIQVFGEMDVLCTDKTGTLTEDRIILEKYLNPSGEDDTRVLRHAYLNSSFQTGLKNLMDLAIISRAEQSGMTEVLKAYRRVDEIPFDFTRRRMSVVLEDQNGKRQLITKGAVEELLSICSLVELNGTVQPLDDAARAAAMAVYEQHNKDGLRMIAVAQKNEVPGSGVFSVADEKDMVLLGFVGFLDPPKKSAGAAIAALREHGVRTVVLTGDSEGVAVKVCAQVGVDTGKLLTGRDVEAMDDAALKAAAAGCDLFAKLSPSQKERVVRALQGAGHTVGYMGDGINDAPALRQADVGISVDSAVDIAKETADIILLKKDLMVLEQGVLEGRRTFGNIIKYIKMAASGNFGNMISVVAASILLPFLPMLPVQILTQNLLCDFSQMGIPFDDMDQEYMMRPHKWETRSIKAFMSFLGPLSSLFDLLCYGLMWYVAGANTLALAPLFHCGWFVLGTLSQVLVIHMIRTRKLPFVGSRPSPALLASSLIVAALALCLGFTGLAAGLDMTPLPLWLLPWLLLIILGYLMCVQLAKRLYVKHFGEWI